MANDKRGLKKPLRFSRDLVSTFTDVPGKSAIVIHMHNMCPLNCYMCHNEEFIKEGPNKDSIDLEQLKDSLSRANFAQAIVITGGEPLSRSVDDLIYLIDEIRTVFLGKIYFNTSGFYTHTLSGILPNIAGVYMDIKFPYWEQEIQPEYSSAVGITNSMMLEKIRSNSLASLELLFKNPNKANFRTVRYPQYDPSVFERIQHYVESRNPEIPYQVNDFLTL
jgi:pyruvate-formate lyase-activating enzyme